MHLQEQSTRFTLLIFLLIQLIQFKQAINVSEHVKAQASKLHTRCVKQTGVDEALIAQARTGDIPTDQTFKCFMHCIFDIVGLIDSENVMHLEYLAELLPEEVRDKVMNLANACGTKHGVDACDTAFQSAVCYFKTDPDFIKSVVDTLLP